MISVVIPAYNSAKSICRAIDSILAQSYCDYEIIVIDDGSTDNTAAIVSGYGSQVNYIYEENSGVCVARNAGVKAANGQWIAFLDHDDQWSPEKLARQMEIVENNSDLRWCTTNYFQDDGSRCTPVCDPEKVASNLSDRDYFESYFVAAGKRIIRIMPTTIMIRTDVFDEVGGFDPELRRSEDTDLWCRIALRYPRIGCVPEPLATRFLNISVPAEVIKLRLKQRTGEPMRKVLARYFSPAKKLGCLDDYKLFAAMELQKILLICIYSGHKYHARKTITEFNDLFGWYWRIGTYLLTVFPRVTAALLHLAAYIAYILRLDRQASRRWLYPKNSAEKIKTEDS
jgi:glycosyltransferase involved in cell wall biosynthesis